MKNNFLVQSILSTNSGPNKMNKSYNKHCRISKNKNKYVKQSDLLKFTFNLMDKLLLTDNNHSPNLSTYQNLLLFNISQPQKTLINNSLYIASCVDIFTNKQNKDLYFPNKKLINDIYPHYDSLLKKDTQKEPKKEAKIIKIHKKKLIRNKAEKNLKYFNSEKNFNKKDDDSANISDNSFSFCDNTDNKLKLKMSNSDKYKKSNKIDLQNKNSLKKASPINMKKKLSKSPVRKEYSPLPNYKRSNSPVQKIERPKSPENAQKSKNIDSKFVSPRLGTKSKNVMKNNDKTKIIYMKKNIDAKCLNKMKYLSINKKADFNKKNNEPLLKDKIKKQKIINKMSDKLNKTFDDGRKIKKKLTKKVSKKKDNLNKTYDNIYSNDDIFKVLDDTKIISHEDVMNSYKSSATSSTKMSKKIASNQSNKNFGEVKFLNPNIADNDSDGRPSPCFVANQVGKNERQSIMNCEYDKFSFCNQSNIRNSKKNYNN